MRHVIHDGTRVPTPGRDSSACGSRRFAVVDPFACARAWPASTVAVGVAGGSGVLASRGPADRALPVASVTKLLTSAAVLVAVEEGAVGLDDPAGPTGSTVRHLLAHASGLGMDSRVALAAPGTRRIYSNAGFELLAESVERATDIAFTRYLTEAIIEPLGLAQTLLAGSPAHGAVSSLVDLLALGREFLAPRILHPQTLLEATTVAFPGLAGVVPGFGVQDPNDWGLGFELRDAKSPHWTGRTNSPATFGHFGRSGAFLWVDRAAGVACACLTDREFDDWAKRAWPELSDAVLEQWGSG